MAHASLWSTAGDPGRRLGGRVEFHPSIGSTNDRAWELLADGDVGTAVVADLQTAGRGRRGRTWNSPSGVNLMVSIGVRPQLAAGDVWQLGAATALAVLDACRSVVPLAAREGLSLKWPNDVVDESGRKLAGLLLETAISDGRVAEAGLGAGINVNWPRAEMPVDLAPRATSLMEIGAHQVDRVALLGAYLAALSEELERVEAGRSPLERYQRASWLTGREVRVAAGEGSVAGRVRGIAGDGSLEVERDGAIVGVAYGEVVQVSA